MNETIKVTKTQAEMLHGFYLHVWGVEWDGQKPEYGNWAYMLDHYKIPWSAQNRIAGLAYDDRLSYNVTMSTRFERVGIEVQA